MRAGIDRREQKKQLVNLERDSLRRARAAAGIEESTETRRQERERERIADMYDGFDMRVRSERPTRMQLPGRPSRQDDKRMLWEMSCDAVLDILGFNVVVEIR
jgi:hypothetical protein